MENKENRSQIGKGVSFERRIDKEIRRAQETGLQTVSKSSVSKQVSAAEAAKALRGVPL